MTGAQYIVDSLIRRGVTDAFGIPGGVILRFIYEMDERKDEIMPHLSYHEQAAGFAACGYAQSSGKLGVAYATRGPGFTNLISAIADAYYDSLPVLFITAHAAPCPPEGMRVMADQEMDTCGMIRNITKEAVRADDAEYFSELFEHLCDKALEGRKGPVFLDVASKLLNQEIPVKKVSNKDGNIVLETNDVSNRIANAVREAKRPVILVGDGISQAGARESFGRFVNKVNVPVISSRFSHDVLGGSTLYYGYVGSHGMRCANFILSKTDLIVSIGNRLHFPPQSQTFGEIFEHAKLIRCEIDEGEFNREIPNSLNVTIDISQLLQDSINTQFDFGQHDEWLRTCDLLREELWKEDLNDAVYKIAGILRDVPDDYSIVNDVGNNEFWVSRASVYAKKNHRTFYSKSFGALGCGLGKAIGVYYATHKPIVCFVGDQGIQMNIQELQYIGQHQLPIIVVLINNSASGMIKDRESATYDYFLHTTSYSGFSSPNYLNIAQAYSMGYVMLNKMDDVVPTIVNQHPTLVEMSIDDNIGLTPNLPRGVKCQDMQPALSRKKYAYLNQL